MYLQNVRFQNERIGRRILHNTQESEHVVVATSAEYQFANDAKGLKPTVHERYEIVRTPGTTALSEHVRVLRVTG